jgi:hypothetical protein
MSVEVNPDNEILFREYILRRVVYFKSEIAQRELSDLQRIPLAL